jgi:hypothetical protein
VGIEGTVGSAGVYEGEGEGAGDEKPDNESLGLVAPVADLGRGGLRASEGSEFEGICQPPSLA